MAYTFEQILAVDPSNPANVARAASITIFAPGDAAKTPLTLTDTNGSPLPNPLTVNANGFGPAFIHATLDRVAWEGGGFTGFLTSYEGMKQEAIDARTAAETAAATAGADAAAVADAAIGDATAEAEAAAASAAAAEAAAASSATAAANSAALVGAPADTAIAAAVNGNGATKAALNATFVRRVKPIEADIRAAALEAKAAGGGTVIIPPKVTAGVWEPIPLTASLPLLDGVAYVGTPPVMDADIYGPPGAYMPDFESHFIGGTVFQGNGTFPAFSANDVDAEVIDTNWGSEQISGATLIGLGFDNFSRAISAGAKNRMGLVYGKLDEIYVTNCTDWGIWLVNFQHMDIGVIRVWSTNKGQFYGAAVPPSTLIPGNSQARELFTKVKYQAGGTTNKYRGTVIGTYGMDNGDVGGFDVDKLQVNAFNRALQSVTATFTNASANVTVPDGNVFAPLMPVRFTATGNGFTANKIYIVRTVAGNTLTLSDSHFGSIITATGSGTLTVETRGYPNLELLGPRSGHLHDVDVEGQSTVGVYAEDSSQLKVSVATLPTNSLVDIVARRAPILWEVMQPAATTDFDSLSAEGSYNGQRGATYGRLLRGSWKDSTTGTYGFSVGSGFDGNNSPDFQVRKQGFIYPAYAGMGEHVYQRDTSRTLDGTVIGHVIVTGSSSPTFTLQEVTVASTPLTSLVGAWYHIHNTGTGTVTVTTTNGQLFNRATGKTSLTVGPGASLKVIAAEDSIRYWLAIPGTLA